MWLLVPEAGARYRIYLMYCLQQGCTVIRLLHMVVVSWAGFGNQATTWGGQTMKAHLSAPQGSRNTAQTLPSCSSCKSTMCLKVAKITSKAETTVDASYGNHFNQDSLNVITELEGKPTFKTMRKMLTAEYAIE